MTLDELKSLVASGEFHHATVRCDGTLWDGLHIYKKDNNGFNGFTHAGCFYAGRRATAAEKEAVDAAHALVRHTGVSFGAYGRG